jgi:mono/diheme cytochrome c family protein
MNKKLFFLVGFAVSAAILVSCGGGSTENKTTETKTPEATTADVPSYDPKRGEGKFDASNVTLGALDAAMASKGEAISGTKCTSCHKLTDEKLVGPGWKGVTQRRTGHWIMNFITNPDPMIDKDPEVQAQLELCLVRMPNQSLADEDARNILEYMRKNDGAK